MKIQNVIQSKYLLPLQSKIVLLVCIGENSTKKITIQCYFGTTDFTDYLEFASLIYLVVQLLRSVACFVTSCRFIVLTWQVYSLLLACRVGLELWLRRPFLDRCSTKLLPHVPLQLVSELAHERVVVSVVKYTQSGQLGQLTRFNPQREFGHDAMFQFHFEVRRFPSRLVQWTVSPPMTIYPRAKASEINRTRFCCPKPLWKRLHSTDPLRLS